MNRRVTLAEHNLFRIKQITNNFDYDVVESIWDAGHASVGDGPVGEGDSTAGGSAGVAGGGAGEADGSSSRSNEGD